MKQHLITYSHVSNLCIYREQGAYLVGIHLPNGTLQPLQDATFWTYTAALVRYRQEQRAVQA